MHWLQVLDQIMYPNIELAELDNKELIYGTYEECEAYADKQKSWVIRYFDHVNPSTVYRHFKYIGNEMSDPYLSLIHI